MQGFNYYSIACFPLPYTADEPAVAPLACLRDISENGGLAELYRGGQLLRIRRAPCGKHHAAPREQWLLRGDATLPERFRDIGHGAKAGRISDQRDYKAPPRSAIRGFSRASRMRLLSKMNMIASRELPSWPKFLTFTYPRELLPNVRWAKRQLHAWFQWAYAKWGKFPAIWRMEYQEDGSVHFHVLAFVKRFLPWWEVAKAWDRLIGNQVDPWHSASTSVQALRSWRQASYYCAKYMAKDDDASALDDENGRHWGVRYWLMLPVHKVRVPLSEAEFYALRRVLARWRLAKGLSPRYFGGPVQWCGTRDIGISLFVADTDVYRLLSWLRGRKITADSFALAPSGLHVYDNHTPPQTERGPTAEAIEEEPAVAAQGGTEHAF